MEYSEFVLIIVLVKLRVVVNTSFIYMDFNTARFDFLGRCVPEWSQ